MKVLVCGSRCSFDYMKVWLALKRIEKKYPKFRLVVGCAKGVDEHARNYMVFHERGGDAEVYKADWANLGKAAGPIRNKRMLEEGEPDVVVAFSGGVGTANMVSQAIEAGIVVWEVT